VEALARRVAVMSGGEVVASGTPDSIGGRDSGMVTIRFRLPDGVPAADLPVGVQPGVGGEVEIRTEDELPVLHALTGWALDRGVQLPGLTVRRVTLEDVYLTLTGDEPASGTPDGEDRAGQARTSGERAAAGQERSR
jgi:ABC-2 type transport system ATP-binding protein